MTVGYPLVFSYRLKLLNAYHIKDGQKKACTCQEKHLLTCTLNNIILCYIDT